jgi:hypothetical protein
MTTKNPPTYEDAKLLLKLYDLRREEKLRAARKWLGSMPQLRSRAHYLELAPAGSEENAYFRMALTYWDMAATLVATGVLHKELFFRGNNLELLFVWEKVRPMIGELREASKNRMYGAALEEVAGDYIAWYDEHSPGFYQQLQTNVANIKAPAKP